MEQQREGQGATGTGFGSTGGATGGSTGGFADNVSIGTRPGFSGAGEDAAARPGSYDRKISEKLGESRERVGEAVHTGKARLADQLQRVGDRLHERARSLEETGGVQGRAGHVALRASETIDRSADYLRNHEIDEMRDDLENAIRQRPLLSIGIAAGAGFLLARLLRD